MIRQIKKVILCMTLFMAGLTIQCQQDKEDANASYSLFVSNIATKMIDAMQGALHINRLTHQQLAVSANQKMTDTLMLKVNESKSLFARLLDEYIENLGQVYEKKSGLFGGYRTSYYIASKADQSLSITPDQYAAFMQTLQNAAQQSDWGTTIKIMFPVMSHENRSVIEKDLSLNEIIAAIKQVPLPVDYSPTIRGIAIGAVSGAAAVGAYYAYNNMDALKSSVAQIENYWSDSSSVTPVAAPAKNFDKEKFEQKKEEAKQKIKDFKQKIENTTALLPKIYEQHQGLNHLNNLVSDLEGIPVAEPTLLQNMGNNATAALFGNEVKTVPGWQGGGDAETYGAPGLSGADLNDTVSLLTMGHSAGGLVKSGVNAVKTGVNNVRNYVGSVGTAAGDAAAAGAGLGIAEASGLAAQTAAKAVPTKIAGQARSGSVSPNWAANFENLPAGYVKPIPSAITPATPKPISPNWPNYFGQ